MTPKKFIEMSRVQVVCTTDNPIDDLKYHKLLDKENNTFKVKPAFRPDKAINIELSWFNDWVNQLSKVVGFMIVATTLRESHSASDNGWSALIYDGKSFYYSKSYDIRIVDRVGGGDAFSGGLIHGLLTKNNPGEALEFAVAASALKHTIFGDYNLVDEKEVDTLSKGDVSGRVQR